MQQDVVRLKLVSRKAPKTAADFKQQKALSK